MVPQRSNLQGGAQSNAAIYDEMETDIEGVTAKQVQKGPVAESSFCRKSDSDLHRSQQPEVKEEAQGECQKDISISSTSAAVSASRTSSESAAEITKREKILPIFIEHERTENVISCKLLYKKAQTIGEGIRLTFQSTESCRKTKKTLVKEKVRHYTVSFPSEEMRVVIGGNPTEVPKTDIQDDLRS